MCQQTIYKEKPDLAIANIKRGEMEMEMQEAEQERPKFVPEGEKKKVSAVAELAVDALAKEVKYEQLAEDEELQREVLAELETRKNLEQLKAANECMARDERKAQAAAKEAAALDEAAAEVQDMKGNIKSMVMNQRANASKKIMMMKKLADKKMRENAGAAQDLRTRMAKQAMAAAKFGDAKKCDPKQPAADKTKYCNVEFDTDPDLNKDCKDPE